MQSWWLSLSLLVSPVLSDLSQKGYPTGLKDAGYPTSIQDTGDSSVVYNEIKDTAIDRSGHGHTDAAAIKMEKQFLYILSTIVGKVDPAVDLIVEDLTNSNLRAQSYGYAMVGGGFGDSLADYVENTRQPQDILGMPDVLYAYGYNVGYGFGFGGPFILPTYLSDTNLDCSSRDFLRVVSKYGFTYGVPLKIGESKIHNFGIDAKQSLHCVLQHSGDYPEAAEVGYLIDDLVEAGVAVSRLSA